MGICLIFYGVTEPLNHFLTPPNLSTDNLEMVKQVMILYIVVMLSIKQKQIAMLITNRVEVLLGQGGQYYDIISYSKDQVIADIVIHLHYLHLAVADKNIIN